MGAWWGGVVVGAVVGVVRSGGGRVRRSAQTGAVWARPGWQPGVGEGGIRLPVEENGTGTGKPGPTVAWLGRIDVLGVSRVAWP